MFDETKKTEEKVLANPFGLSLRKARESLGLSLNELSKTLNLSIGILEALEKSEVDKLPPTIYVQGYIKAYTKALGISSEAIHDEYMATVNTEKTMIELRPRSPLPLETNSETPIIKTISVLFGMLALAAALFGVYTYYINKISTMDQSNQTEVSVKIPLKKMILVVTQDAWLTGDDELIVGESVSSVVNSETVDETTTEEINDEPVVVQETAAKVEEKKSATQTIANQDRLIIKAKAESWAEIRDSNKEQLFVDMLHKDDYLILTGKAPFDIFLGNALNIEIEVNGVVVDMSDYIRINNVAHFKVSETSNQIVFH